MCSADSREQAREAHQLSYRFVKKIVLMKEAAALQLAVSLSSDTPCVITFRFHSLDPEWAYGN